MDYQGNYFPEEQDENESKVYRIIKGIFKWTMYGISFIIYIILFYLMFVNRDSKILETNYMGKLPQLTEVETEEMELYRINTKVFMNEDGSLQLYNIDYSDEYDIIEIGVKFNAKKLTDERYSNCLEYVLSDSEGNTYDLVNSVTDSGGRYGFARICFNNIDLDIESNDLRYNNALYGSVKPAFMTDNYSDTRTKTTYNLAIYRKSDGTLLYDFELYDNSVTFTRTEYED